MAEIIAVVENVDNGAGQPEAGVLRVIAAGAPRALKLHRPQRDDLHFPQAAGDLSGTVALGGKLENQLDNRRGFRVGCQISLTVPQVAVESLSGEPLAAHALCPEHSADLLARVLLIPFVDGVS